MTDRAAARMSFWAHLAELRTRVIRAALWVALAAGVAYMFREQVYSVLYEPLNRAAPGLSLHFFSPTEPFFIYLRIALYAGLVAASPLVLLEAWGFIAPGMTRQERHMVRPIVPVAALLFIGGVLFVYFMLLPLSIQVLLGFAGPHMEAVLSQERYFNFVLGLCLAGGLLFELPMVLAILGWLGIVEPAWLWHQSAYAFVLLMIVSAVITPTGDAFTMLALTLPLMVLYWASIVLVWLIQRRRPDSE